MGYEFCVDERVLDPETGYGALWKKRLNPLEESGKTADPGYVYRLRLYSAESSSGTAQACGTGVDVSDGALVWQRRIESVWDWNRS